MRDKKLLKDTTPSTKNLPKKKKDKYSIPFASQLDSAEPCEKTSLRTRPENRQPQIG
jgi:hypothetical protein